MKALSLQLTFLLAIAWVSIIHGVPPVSVNSDFNATANSNITDFSCLNRTFDMYFPNVETGCQKFHLCTKTEGDELLNLSFMCPEGTAFDSRSADCQSKETVVCKPENGGTRAVRKAAKHLKHKLHLAQPKTSFKCLGKKLGNYYADQETNCSTFHLCTMGEFKSEILDFQFMCLEGTLFDEKWLQCRPESITPCGKNPPILSKTITTTPPVETTAQETTTVQTTTVQATTVVPDPEIQTQQQQEIQEVFPPEYIDYNVTDADYEYFDEILEQPVREKRSTRPLRIRNVMSVLSEKIRVKRAPPPNLSMESLPPTSFSCADKIPGGYYADVETGCQLYHVCAPGADGAMRSTKFLCGNDTIFSQQTRTCQLWYTVDCDSTPHFFALNEELSRVLPEDLPSGSFTPDVRGPSVPDVRRPSVPSRQQIQSDSVLFDIVPTRQSSQGSQQVRQQESGPPTSHVFDIIPDRQHIPVVQQQFLPQPQPVVEDSRGTPEFINRFQQLAEQQRVEDAVRENVTPRPARKRKQKRRRKQRPTTQRPQEDLQQQLQQDILALNIPVAQTPVEDTFLRRPAPALQQSFIPEFTAGQRQQITLPQPQAFNIQENIPGLLEEIQVRGRFRQTEDDFLPQLTQQEINQARTQEQARRVPLHHVRLQQQESIEVRVPTTQRIAAVSSDSSFGSSLTGQQSGQIAPSVQQSSPPPQTGGAIFDGFDAFIQAAIQQEHEQRANLGPILEQRRRQEEEERQREEQRQKQNRRRKRPRTTTTARPEVRVAPQEEAPPNFDPTQEFQPAFAVVRQQEQPASRFNVAEFIGSGQAPQVNQQGGNSPVLLSDISFLQPAQLSHPEQSRSQQRQNIPSLTVTQPDPNLNAFLFQQFAQRQQPLNSNPAAAVRDVLFLVPAESEQLPSTIFRQEPALSAQPIQSPVIAQPAQSPVIAQPAQSPVIAQPIQSQLIRFESPQSSGFEIRSRFRRQTPPEFLKLTHSKSTEYPATPFTCKDKLMGGYYADIYTNCEMFHICTSGRRKGLLYDFRFWCANDTVFDQRSQTCNAPEKVNCNLSPKYYPRHPLPEEPDVPVPNAELFKVRVKRAIKNVIAIRPNDSPSSSFACTGRDANRYYADPETNCQLFHLCAENSPGGRLVDYRFLCRNGTVFDQRSQACDDQTDALNCQEDPPHYGIGEVFGSINRQ